MNKKFIVNIGRQLGSGGREIGEKLAARLGIDFYDKELIRLASEESGLCKEFLKRQMKRLPKVYWAACSECVSPSSGMVLFPLPIV